MLCAEADRIIVLFIDVDVNNNNQSSGGLSKHIKIMARFIDANELHKIALCFTQSTTKCNLENGNWVVDSKLSDLDI